MYSKPTMKAVMTQHDKNFCTEASRGAVLLELVLSLFLFFLLLSGIIDFGTLMRQRSVLTDAAHAGALAIMNFPPYDGYLATAQFPRRVNRSTPYGDFRAQEGLNTAIQYVARQGLVYSDYYYLSYVGWLDSGVTSLRNPPATDLFAQINVTIRPRASTQRNFIILPNFVVKTCAVARVMVSGEFNLANQTAGGFSMNKLYFFPTDDGAPSFAAGGCM